MGFVNLDNRLIVDNIKTYNIKEALSDGYFKTMPVLWKYKPNYPKAALCMAKQGYLRSAM